MQPSKCFSCFFLTVFPFFNAACILELGTQGGVEKISKVFQLVRSLRQNSKGCPRLGKIMQQNNILATLCLEALLCLVQTIDVKKVFYVFIAA